RYVLMNTEGEDCGTSPESEIRLSLADRWIRSRLQHTIDNVTEAIEGYRFDHAAQAIYEFTWNEYCDWYLELSKTVLNDENTSEAARRGTRKTLVTVLETLLRLAHPVIPFITEEIWQQVTPLAGTRGETIMLQPWPVSEESLRDTYSEDEMQWVMQFILGIRKIKGEMNISPGKQVPVLLSHCTPIDEQRAIDHRPYLDFLARTESISVLSDSDEEPDSAITLVGDMRVLIPMAGLIDKEAEIQRLEKEIGRLDGEIQRLEKKLSNRGFVDKAPEAVVQKERDKLVEAEKALANLQAQIHKIRAL
ncbi:MAG: class I tRNA ligase family protein, partial [Chromatiales bacterium]